METLFHVKWMVEEPKTLHDALTSIHQVASTFGVVAKVAKPDNIESVDIKDVPPILMRMRDAVVRDLVLHDAELTARDLILLGLMVPVRVMSMRQGTSPAIVTFIVSCFVPGKLLTVPIKVGIQELKPDDRDLLLMMAPALAVFMNSCARPLTMDNLMNLGGPEEIVVIPEELEKALVASQDDMTEGILMARRALRRAGFSTPKLDMRMSHGPKVGEWLGARMDLAEAAGELQGRIESKLKETIDSLKSQLERATHDILELTRRHSRTMGMMMLDADAALP